METVVELRNVTKRFQEFQAGGCKPGAGKRLYHGTGRSKRSREDHHHQAYHEPAQKKIPVPSRYSGWIIRPSKRKSSRG